MPVGERRLRILRLLMGPGQTDLGTSRLCEGCAEVTGMSGAGIMLMSGEVPNGSLCATNEVSALIEQLQFGLGEGPCVDAYQEDRPVLEPDLVNPKRARWLAFAETATAAGVRAVFGFPLQVGAVRLGALNLYRDRSGTLTDEQHADALVLAGVVAQAILVLQAGAPPGKIAEELEASADFQYGVHQASGMVATQLGVTVGQAFVRLRGLAFANNRPLAAVANDVVARSLRFDSASGEAEPCP